MFRQWIWIGILILLGTPLWAQGPRAIKRDREAMVSGQRVALVIGNGAYTGSVASLRNPVNDARGITQALKEIEFEVISLYDANKSEIGDAIHEFSELIDSEGVALFYFSGHGLEVDGINYLVPIGAKIQKKYQVKYQCNSANEILDMMEEKRGNRINVVILDACRDNPFKTRSIGGRGLAAMPSSPGSLIAYAASAGNVAEDGVGRHSPYTESLIKHIQTPGLEIEDVFKAVGKDVLSATNDAQNPGRYSNLNDDFYLVPLPSTKPDRQTFEPPPITHPSNLTDILPGGVEMEFVYVPPGTFMMGSPDSEDGRDEDEGPVHEVEISQGFYLSKYEVTRGAYSRFVSATGHPTGNSCSWWNGSKWENRKEVNWRNPGFGQTNNHPVVCVSWEDAQAYARWLSDETGYSYRLPSESEWEYACRAGMSSQWSFGDNARELNRYAWYSGNNNPYGTKSVGGKLPNAWGLYDMHGNVWEWVQDWYGAYSVSPSIDPMGPLTGSYRVVRGGFFYNCARYVRSASRDSGSPGSRSISVGFRLLRRAN